MKKTGWVKPTINAEMKKKEKQVRGSGLCISAFVTILLMLSILPFSAHSEEYYKFERLWPVLKQPWYFLWPQGIDVDISGNVYVADTYNHRILKFSSNGMFITSWGNGGTGNGQFLYPASIAVDSIGNVYVADTWNNRIQKFTSNGTFLKMWGSRGSRNRQFSMPQGIAVDSIGNVYVADTFNNRIQKFTKNGWFITAWGDNGTGDGQFDWPQDITVDSSGNVFVVDTGNARIQKFTKNGRFITAWGSKGTGNGQFAGPEGIAIDSSGNIYVADSDHHIKKFTAAGTFITAWGSKGPGNGQFNLPGGIVVDNAGNVYVVEEGNSRIQKFTSDGTFIAAWESAGSGNGQFNGPGGIAVDSSGSVFVAETWNDRIQKFTEDGTFITAWGSTGTENGQFSLPEGGVAVDSTGNVYVADTYNLRIQKFTSDGAFITAWGSYGTGNGQFSLPVGIAIDSSSNVYVVDRGNDRIQKFTEDGLFITAWGSEGTGNGQFDGPEGIAVDSSGNVYVADSYNGRIQKFSSDGAFIIAWGSWGTENGQFAGPQGIAIDNLDNVYVYDIGNCRIQMFSSGGIFLNTWGASGSEPGFFGVFAGIAVNAKGMVYVADTSNNRVQVFKKVDVLDNPKAIIVAGGGPGDWNSLWDATQLNANYAYRALTYQGYTKQSIFYLSANTDLDLDGNGLADDVDRDSTSANLAYAITQWALDADSVIIYLVDHGGDGTFRMAENDILTAAELDGWINELQEKMTGRVIVVYDACESGSFQNALQGPNRTIITSTSEGERAKFLNQGSLSFSFFFWTYIFNGMTLDEAFNAAAQNINFSFDSQTPVGSGLEPGVVVGNGVDQHFGQGPVIGQVSPPLTLTWETSATIYASDITGSAGIESVWAVIWRPNYETSPDSPALNLPQIELVYNRARARYEGVYKNCTKHGTYQVAVYAMDRTGRTSLSKLTTIAKNYNLKRRVILVGGTETAGMPWSNIEKSLRYAYGAVKAQGYADDTELKVYAPHSIPGVTATVSLNTLEYLESAITQWGAENTQDLVLYLVGAGSDGAFRLNDTETLTAAALDGWLDSLKWKITGKVIVVYDADRSGSFIPLLTSPAWRKRIVITSTGASSAAYFSAEGNLSFSSNFWSQIASGATVYNAFAYTKKAIAYLSHTRNIAFSCYLDQSPVLDDNGNGIGNEKDDGAVARRTPIGMGMKFAADPPQIGAAGAQNAVGGILITAGNISTTGTIQSVWALVTSLGYCPGSTGTGPAQVVRVEMVVDNVSPGTYAGLYMGAEKACKIAVYARDTDNQTSAPRETKVYQSQGEDMYEIDDTPAQARVIVINQGMPQADGTTIGLAQPHNFHYAADVDWVMFYGLAGQNYMIQADNLGINSQPVIELYGSDATLPIAVESSIIDNKVFLDWQCDEDGVYYVRLWNNANALETGTEYELSVYIPELPLSGFITGTIKDAVTKNAISGAHVITNGKGSDISEVNGDFYIVHQAGAYSLWVQAQGYRSSPSSSIRVEEGEFVTKNITLIPITTTTTTTIDPSKCIDADGDGYGQNCAKGDDCNDQNANINPGVKEFCGDGIDNNCNGKTDEKCWCPIARLIGANNPNLSSLRSFRDGALAESKLGRKAIQLYYGNAAGMNETLDRSPGLKAVTRRALEIIAPMVGRKE